MSCTLSVIITAFQRPLLLSWGLYSLTRQHIPFDFETIVVNDGLNDETEAVCDQYREKLNLKYIFSGQRNLKGEIKYRIPGFAVNIGARQSTGEILIISCAEMFHLNDTLAKLTYPLRQYPHLLGIPVGKDDQDSSFLNHLMSNNGRFELSSFYRYPDLNVHLPFLMSVSRERFFAIGGYDEDFTGYAYDDNDLVDRLQLSGCQYCQTQAKTIHLYHPRYTLDKGGDPLLRYNYDLYRSKQGKIVRNANREWGKL